MPGQFDLIKCMKQPGMHIGKVCSKCEGKCPTCPSLLGQYKVVHICDECAEGSTGKRCILCGASGGPNGENLKPAYYCYECCLKEKDRDGCPRIINMGAIRGDIYFQRKRLKPQ